MTAARTSRRSLFRTLVIGGASGVLGTTAIHAVGHAGEMTATESMGMGAMVDVGFCTDMTAHHVQALTMCERVLGRDTGDAVQAAATEVLRNQAVEVGMMRAWLADWGASTSTPETVMSWLTMADMGMADGETGGIPLTDMPGYASDDEMHALATADPGTAMGRLWLQLMRAHHVGGVAMADVAAVTATEAKVIRLARTQSAAQAYEIAQYDELLASTYA